MSKSTQASETLQSAVSFFGWESEATEKSARNRIASALSKDISTASGALRGTGQSLASLSREIPEGKNENDKNLLDFMSAIFIGAGLLAKHFEKPAPEAQAPAVEAKPKATRGTKRAKPATPEAGTIASAINAEQLAQLIALAQTLAK